MNTITNLPVRVVTNLQASAIHRRAQADERGAIAVEWGLTVGAIIVVGMFIAKTLGAELGQRLIEALVNAIFSKITGIFK